MSIERLRSWFAKLDIEESVRCWIGPRLRRIVNFSITSIALLLLIPVFLFIAILIKLDSPGPVFYWGTRVGKKGKLFKMLKFRTMYERKESYQGPKITGGNDSRITPIGQWLRDTKLNELPQLWNVFKGEMNLVGPRPEDPDYIQHWPEDMRRVLLRIHPGVTSPASIIYRDEENMMQSDDVESEYVTKILPHKLRLDMRYVEKRSVVGDFDVIFLTLATLLPIIGQRRIPNETLYWGPISRFTSRYFSWFAADTIVAFLAFAVVGFLWRLNSPLNVGIYAAMFLSLIMAVTFSMVNYLLGLSRMMWSQARGGYVLLLFASSFITTSVLIILNRLNPRPLPNDMLMVVGILAFLGFVTVRYRLRLISALARHWLNSRPQTTTFGERVLVVGAGGVGRFATTLLQGEELMPAFSMVGMVDDDPMKEGRQVGYSRVLGTTSDIKTLVEKYEIDLVVFAIAEIEESDRSRILNLCTESGARVVVLPDIVFKLKDLFLPDSGIRPARSSSYETYQVEINELNNALEQRQWDKAQAISKSLQAGFTRIHTAQIRPITDQDE